MKRILGIETSCDECSASVVRAEVLDRDWASLKCDSVATFSQVGIHRPYGGVVPEIASRNHLETVNHMIDQAMKEAGVSPADLDAVAVTNRPGLIGALLVGVSAAKALAYAIGRPLIPVHHLEGHGSSVFLDKGPSGSKIPLPCLMAIVSGGHTNLHVIKEPPLKWPENLLHASLVGRSIDDAAGEAFDKTAKLMGYPYPGGKWIDEGAEGGDPSAFDLPRALPKKTNLDFSFSGLKTAVSLHVQKLKKEGELESRRTDLCASVQEAIVDVLLRKIFAAIRKYRCRSLVLVGGVAANSRLRLRLKKECPVTVYTPDPKYCTDNAAMIAAAGAYRFLAGRYVEGMDLLKLNASANPGV